MTYSRSCTNISTLNIFPYLKLFRLNHGLGIFIVEKCLYSKKHDRTLICYLTKVGLTPTEVLLVVWEQLKLYSNLPNFTLPTTTFWEVIVQYYNIAVRPEVYVNKIDIARSEDVDAKLRCPVIMIYSPSCNDVSHLQVSVEVKQFLPVHIKCTIWRLLIVLIQKLILSVYTLQYI